MTALRAVLSGVLSVWIQVAGAQPATSQVCKIDGEGSDVHWRVYRAGAFGGFGHNHVISAGGLSGVVCLQPHRAASSWEIEIIVADLVVDDPELRARYGDDFSTVPSSKDIAGTRRNMLGDRVLDAGGYPVIRVSGQGFSGEPAGATLPITVEILGRDIELSVPGTIVIGPDSLTASGSFSLTHEQLGMKPFSVMLGSLRVGRRIDFSYVIHALCGHETP